MSNLSTLPKGDSAWLLRKAIERIIQQVSVLETNIGSSTTGNSTNTQIIFNDNGTLRGDAGLVYNKTTDTLTAGNATITGAATVGTTFAVGTVTPDIFARFYTRSIGFDSSGSTMLQINGTSYGGIDLGAAGVRTFGITSSASDANISTVTNIPMIFNINSSTKMTLNTAGNLAFPTGKGIDFSAVTGGTGTATANVLNDYEEGTFTPTVGGSTSNGTAVYTIQKGVYTKIGRIVQIQIFVEWNTGTATGNQTVIGLPFTSNSTSGNYSVLNTYPINISLTALHIATSSIPPSTSIVNIYQIPTGGGGDISVPCDAAGAFLLTGTYTV